MAQVRGEEKQGTGKLLRVAIDLKANGFEITKEYEPEKQNNGMMSYEPARRKDSSVFTKASQALAYLKECMGESSSGE